MKIPTSFYLFGQKITVEWSDTLIEDEDAVGHASFRKNLIRIQKDGGGISRPLSHKEKTFCHELIHWIFHVLGEDDLTGNEKLVDNMAQLLHQALATAEYK